ncbi:MAG: universal stress protein [Syntrophobacteraceae bacterium]|nr:universal stress protein [Syntrophobacteraceae bacterium]
MYTRILVPTDGSACSRAAAEYARDLVKLNPSALVTILHVRQLPKPVFRVYRWREVEVPIDEETKRRICEQEERLLAQVEKIFTDAGLPPDTDVVSGAPAEQICAFAELGGYDLIVIGSSRSAGAHTTSHSVLRTAKCPVLLVKG